MTTPRTLQETLAASAMFPALESVALRQAPTYVPPDPQRFGYLFPTLQGDDANLLPDDPATNAALKRLGASMEDPRAEANDGDVPAIYTYFGQLVDHDITLEGQPDGLPRSSPAAPRCCSTPT